MSGATPTVPPGVGSADVPPSSPDEVLVALEQGKPSELIGTPETAQIDFKESAYVLDAEKGKWELAKDVAGLANLSGGVLVVGVRTTKTEGKFLEVASDLRPVPVRLLDKERHHAIIRQLVRPGTASFALAYFPDPDQDGRGYMTIHVKPLPEWERPALIRSIVNDDGKLIDAINIPIRDSDQTRWLSIDECYLLLRSGRQASAPQGTVRNEVKTAETLNWDEVLDRLIAYKDWDVPVLAWQSMPTSTVHLLSKMWGDGSISNSLRHTQPLRSSGFNWSFLSDITQFENGALVGDGRHAIWVRENGTITAAATLGENNMLGWAMHNSVGQPQGLNVAAVSELTLEYFRLVDQAIIPVANSAYTHSVVTRRFAEEPGVTLSPGLPSVFFHALSQKRAGQDSRHEFPGSAPPDPERDTYEALWRFYANFQYGPKQVPFVKNDRFDTQTFIAWARAH